MYGVFLDREIGDWDLQAIVKGCKNSGDHIIAVKKMTEENYNYHGNEPLQHLSILNSGTDQSTPTIPPGKMQKGVLGVSHANSNKEIYKSRRRKNKYEINVVEQVAEDCVLSDKWNWRKYGQKTIKGSPYPRNYYKCSSSSSGGCKARKQVEHSNANPETLLIAYIHEHNHPYPTRRHSQAGRTKERFQPISPKLDLTMNELSSSSRTTTTSNSLDESSSFGGCINEGITFEDISRECVFNVTNLGWEDEVFGGLEGFQMDLLWDGN